MSQNRSSQVSPEHSILGPELPAIGQSLRAAADRSMWALFWLLQGGPDVPRKMLTLAPLYVEDRNGKYGDQVSRVLGIVGRTGGNEYALRTRMHTWTVQRAGPAMVHAADLEQKEWMQTNKRVREFERAAGMPVRSDVRFPMNFSLGQCEALSPWTSVNNCTECVEPISGNARKENTAHTSSMMALRL